MKHQLLPLIFLATASFTNAQTIPKSIDQPLTVKPAKPSTKTVIKKNIKKEYTDVVNQKKKFDVLIPDSYSYKGFPHEGLTVVSLKNHKDGFVDKNDKIIIPFKYENASDFSEGLAAVQLNGKYGCINKSGVVAIPFKYDIIFDFSNGMASVKLNGKYGFINAVGEVVISIKYDQIFYYEDEKIFRAKLNGKSMILDKNGNCVKDCD
jgi:hypothetical protein